MWFYFPFVNSLECIICSFTIPTFSALCLRVVSFVQQAFIEHRFWGWGELCQATKPGLAFRVASCWSQSINSQCCGWNGHHGSGYDCKTAFSINPQDTEKTQVYYLQDLEITQHTWAHTVRWWGARESAGAQSSAFMGVKGEGSGFPGLTCYW